MYGWLCGWVGSCQLTKNQKNLVLIKIFQYCLKIYHLWRHPHLCVCWGGGVMGG